MPLSKEIVTAINPLLILSLVDKEECYAYDLIKQIEKQSNGQVKMQEGTLYPLLKKLKAKDLLRARWKTTPAGYRRKYYSITQAGKVHLMRLQSEWRTANELLAKVVAQDLIGG